MTLVAGFGCLGQRLACAVRDIPGLVGVIDASKHFLALESSANKAVNR